MDRADSPRFVIATHVKAGWDSDFERFMREVVVPAEAAVRPHQVGMWHLLRPSEDELEGASRAWMMTFHGPSALDDWNLEPLFDEAYGVEASRDHLAQFQDMVEGEQVVYALSGEVEL